ncbi:N-acetyl-gamma-glutamyl-phosphate reductase [Adhaeribacter pallidiroseus]|uniref:N-acetyl-gamma-glutamyl-phosphate reductase n=1 Tax=Adhaeribacter pallidiroseus TaxID=2072847 RepID=A0A369QF40_9BACT|nr:N-acetyl-gamma-glutamyl-phosphate reductase [Adhaeribacter pallidiroseus]RDC62930.1 N-acetyl-gamma-glutamyl-phosphate reductase [Adhaeribacter pallidiroseus]
MIDQKIKVGIVGAAGYTGGELLRLLIYHPQVDLVFAHSNSSGGKPLYSVHTDLAGETDLVFSQHMTGDLDVLFLCLGHGDSQKFLAQNTLPTEVKIIDLSQDFRVKPECGDRQFTYGLPELGVDKIRNAQNIANPGCFATAMQLALLPLAAQGLLASDVHISGITGSTGAGQSFSETSHFSWRDSNISAYKVLNHQHLHEMRRTLGTLQIDSTIPRINFVPYRGNFTRGILCTTYLTCNWSLEEANDQFRQFYQDAAFTHVTNQNPHVKQVVNTNKCLVYLEKHEDQLVIISLIDNLLKGASGQAVQNMNLLFHLPETTGLLLKPSGF